MHSTNFLFSPQSYEYPQARVAIYSTLLLRRRVLIFTGHELSKTQSSNACPTTISSAVICGTSPWKGSTIPFPDSSFWTQTVVYGSACIEIVSSLGLGPECCISWTRRNTVTFRCNIFIDIILRFVYRFSLIALLIVSTLRAFLQFSSEKVHKRSWIESSRNFRGHGWIWGGPMSSALV